MSDKSGIEWTDATWSPVRGCSPVSAGCANCYAARMATRFAGPGGPYEGLAKGGKWTGKVRLVPEALDQPLRWRKPRRVFVNSMSDLFHPGVPFEFILEVFEVMERARRHTFQVLTKRPERAIEFCSRYGIGDQNDWPVNVWLGVSVENQKTADERIPLLLQTPAAVRFVSIEPMLGPVDLGDSLGLTWERCDSCGGRYPDIYWADDIQWERVVGGEYAGLRCPACFKTQAEYIGLDPKMRTLKPSLKRLDWVIVGGESGPGARPMARTWVRGIRDQCRAAGVPFMFKQWGEWAPYIGGAQQFQMATQRVGKKAAGRELDGREWMEMP